MNFFYTERVYHDGDGETFTVTSSISTSQHPETSRDANNRRGQSYAAIVIRIIVSHSTQSSTRFRPRRLYSRLESARHAGDDCLLPWSTQAARLLLQRVIVQMNAANPAEPNNPVGLLGQK